MRLLSLILASSGFLFFSLEVSKLLSVLRMTTFSIKHSFQVSNVLLNSKNYYLSGFSDSAIQKNALVSLGGLSQVRFSKEYLSLSCGASVRFVVSWLEDAKSRKGWVSLHPCLLS